MVGAAPREAFQRLILPGVSIGGMPLMCSLPGDWQATLPADPAAGHDVMRLRLVATQAPPVPAGAQLLLFTARFDREIDALGYLPRVAALLDLGVLESHATTAARADARVEWAMGGHQLAGPLVLRLHGPDILILLAGVLAGQEPRWRAFLAALLDNAAATWPPEGGAMEARQTHALGPDWVLQAPRSWPGTSLPGPDGRQAALTLVGEPLALEGAGNAGWMRLKWTAAALSPDPMAERDKLLRELAAAGIEAGPAFAITQEARRLGLEMVLLGQEASHALAGPERAVVGEAHLFLLRAGADMIAACSVIPDRTVDPAGWAHAGRVTAIALKTLRLRAPRGATDRAG